MHKHRVAIGLVLISAFILLIGILPAAAQDNAPIGQCVHIEINTGPDGLYASIFIYLDGAVNTIIPFSPSTTEPNTTLEFDIWIPPQSLFAIVTSDGSSVGAVVYEGYYFEVQYGQGSIHVVPLDTACLGAKTDGRLNRFDKAMLAVIYLDGHDGYDIWKIDASTSEGTFDYNVSSAKIAAGLSAAEKAHTSQIIASSSNSTFYTTPDHQCVVTGFNAGGEPQRFDFDCGA